MQSTRILDNCPSAHSRFVDAARAFGLRCGIAALCVTLACAATSLMETVTAHKSQSLVFFLAAVVISTSTGGFHAGIMATVLSVVCCDYFFLPPFYSLTVAASDIPMLILFVLVALLINGTSERLQARTRAADQRFHDLVEELAALNGITSAISVSLEMSVVVASLKEQLMTRLGVPCGAIFLRNEESQQLILHASWGLPDAILSAWTVLPSDTFADTPQTWKLADWPGTAVPLPANDELQGGLFLGTPQSKQRLQRQVKPKEAAEATTEEPLLLSSGEAFTAFQYCRPAFLAALGRQVGVVIENARLYAQVRAGREHLQLLSRKLVQVQEAERRQIARELHDEIGQVLTGLKLNLEMSARLAPEAVHAHLAGALLLINDLMTHVRDLSLDLRPAMLDDLGLLPTLLWHFQRYSALTQVKVCCEHAGIERRFPFEVETTVYRIVQEALTNVARHAQVREVTVRLWAADDLLGAQIIDAGSGFDVKAARSNFGTGGLAGMEERVILLGGRLTIESAVGKGTRVLAELPLRESGKEVQERTIRHEQDNPAPG